MIFALLLAFQVQAAPLIEKWSATIEDGKPVAAFFDAGSASIFVSVSEGKRARVDRFSLDGKLAKQGIVSAAGEAGALRAHFGKIYWAAGSAIWRFDPVNGKKAKFAALPAELGEVSDIAVARNGNVYVGFTQGSLLEAKPSSVEILDKGEPIGALFLLDAELNLIRNRNIQTFAAGKLLAKKNLCSADCLGLERSSTGAWITAEGKVLREYQGKSSRALVEATEVLGRFAYVYDRDPKNDSVIVPFPLSKTLRAYRFP